MTRRFFSTIANKPKNGAGQFRIGMVALPSFISKEISQAVKEIPKSEVAEGLSRINAFLAKGGSEKLKRIAAKKNQVYLETESLTYDKSVAAAYSCSRMVNSYGALYNAFSKIMKKNPQFSPRTLLDFGAGPGTGFLAAKQFWNIEQLIAIDCSQSMNDLCKRFANLVDANASIDVGQILQPVHKADLVVCAFTLSEMDEKYAKKIIDLLWEKTIDTMVLIDRGTPIGFQIITNAREQLLKKASALNQDVHIVAPVSSIMTIYILIL
jgi:ribosomal protein RSM22 (predicted rRNA methylase)